MLCYVVQIDGYDPVAAAPVTLRASSHDDERICHLDVQTWWPAIADLPSLPQDFFDGDFGAAIGTPSSSMRLQAEPWPLVGRYALADARIRIWSGVAGDPWSAWVARVDGRVTAQPRIADGNVNLAFSPDDRWMDTPLLEPYTGAGGAEGPEALQGVVKPLLLGAPRYATGVLVDPINTVFQLSAYGEIEGVEAALDGLARFAAPAGNYASYDALVAATIAPGAWATARAVGMTRHGAPPFEQITYMARGDRAGPDGWARRPGAIIRRIAMLSGGTGRIDDDTLDALDLACPWNLSVAVTEQTTARALIQRIAASVNAVAGVTWLGKLYVVPVQIGAATLTLSADGSTLPPIQAVEQVEVGAPWWRLAITAERTWTVHPSEAVQYTEPAEPGATVGATPDQVDQIEDNATLIAALQSALAVAQDQIDEIEGSVAVDIADLIDRITAAEGDVVYLETLTASQGSSIATNATAISNVAGDLASLTDTVTAQGAQVVINATAVADANTQIASLSSNLSTANANIATNALAITDLSGSQASMATTLASQGSNIASLLTVTSTLLGDTATMKLQLTAGGGNALTNTDLVIDYADWTGGGVTGAISLVRDLAGSAWRPPNEHVLGIFQSDTDSAAYGEWVQTGIEIEADDWWEASAWVASHRCETQIYIGWRNAAGGIIGSHVGSGQTGTGGFTRRSGGTTLDAFTRLWVKAQAPSGAVRAEVLFRKEATIPAEATVDANSYGWFLRPQFKKTLADTASPLAYSVGGAGASILQQAQALSSLSSDFAALSSTVATTNSNVTVIQAALDDVEGRTAAFWQVTAVSGGRAQLTVFADANGGGGVDIVGDTRINGSLTIDGTLYTAKFAGGALASAPTAGPASGTVTAAYLTKLSITHTPYDADSKLLLLVGGVISPADLPGGIDYSVRIRRDGATDVYPAVRMARSVANSFPAVPFSIIALDSGLTGAHTWDVDMAASANATAGHDPAGYVASFIILELKKAA